MKKMSSKLTNAMTAKKKNTNFDAIKTVNENQSQPKTQTIELLATIPINVSGELHKQKFPTI